MLASLDPLGMPKASQIVSGEQADDGMYLPIFEQVSQTFEAQELLWVGDRNNLAADTPVNTAKLEDQLRLLRLDPLFNNVEASLSAGDNPEVGKSVIKVRVEESDRFTARVSFDNYSPPSIGAERLGTELDYRSLIKGGDRISLRYYPDFKHLPTLLISVWNIKSLSMRGMVLLHLVLISTVTR